MTTLSEIITFGIFIVSLLLSVMDLSPNGKSCTMCEPVVKAMKCFICEEAMSLLEARKDFAGPPLPQVRQWRLAFVNR